MENNHHPGGERGCRQIQETCDVEGRTGSGGGGNDEIGIDQAVEFGTLRCDFGFELTGTCCVGGRGGGGQLALQPLDLRVVDPRFGLQRGGEVRGFRLDLRNERGAPRVQRPHGRMARLQPRAFRRDLRIERNLLGEKLADQHAVADFRKGRRQPGIEGGADGRGVPQRQVAPLGGGRDLRLVLRLRRHIGRRHGLCGIERRFGVAQCDPGRLDPTL